MRLHCKTCDSEITKTLIPASPDQAFSEEKIGAGEFADTKRRIMPGLYYQDTRPVCWVVDIENGVPSEAVPSGDIKDYFILSEESLPLTGVYIVNPSKGCCKLDHFDLQCGCGAMLGWGVNDCWQEDKVLIAADAAYVDESK